MAFVMVEGTKVTLSFEKNLVIVQDMTMQSKLITFATCEKNKGNFHFWKTDSILLGGIIVRYTGEFCDFPITSLIYKLCLLYFSFRRNEVISAVILKRFQ